MYKENFVRNLRRARTNLKITQSELANRVDMTRCTIAKYEAGTTEPSIEKIGELASALGVDIEWLFKYNPEKQKFQ